MNTATRLLFLCFLCGLLRLSPTPIYAAAGDLDPFDAKLAVPDPRYTSVGYTSGVQADGKIIIAGQFQSAQGITRLNIARFNTDGSLDPDFRPQTSGVVKCMVIQPDRKILFGGFVNFNGGEDRLARYHPNGLLDFSLSVKPSVGIYTIALQPDGKILFGGDFTTYLYNRSITVNQSYFARVGPDGTPDTNFKPKLNDSVKAALVQPDGKILIVGRFNTIQSNGVGPLVARNHIARLNADGTLDESFVASTGSPNCLALQPDGKILLGSNGGLIRLNADGTADTTFTQIVGQEVLSVALQVDGKIIVGGMFNTVSNGQGGSVERQKIARLNANGTLDSAFDLKIDDRIETVTIQGDGRVQVGGVLDTVQPKGVASPIARESFALLQNDPVQQTLTVPSANEISWQRSGAGPELTRVYFELSTNGGTDWTSLGAAARVGTSANWRLSNLNLPSGGSIRATGVTGGDGHSSTSLIEQVATFDLVTKVPALIAPVPNAVTKTPVEVSYTLPEAALAGSVELSFNDGNTARVLRLTGEAAGMHSFAFNPANPTASPEVSAGPAIPDGIYHVGILYRDALGNPPASQSSKNVRIDTTPPTGGVLTTNPPSPIAFRANVTVQAEGWNDPTAPLAYQFFIGETPVTDLQASNLALLPKLSSGEYPVKARIVDGLGNLLETAPLMLTVNPPPPPQYTALRMKEGAVPGAGTDQRILAQAAWRNFGPPAINDAGQVAYLGRWRAPAAGPIRVQNGTGIFVDDVLVVKTGDPVPGIPGATFKTLKDPVIDQAGHVAFLATMGSVPAIADTIVVATDGTGALQVLAREGDAAPGANGATFRTFGSVSIQSAAVFSGTSFTEAPQALPPGVLFTATLLKGSGQPAVNAANDAGAWCAPPGSTGLAKMVREGDAGFLPGETIRTFHVLKALTGSPGFGRGQIDGGRALLQITMNNGRQVQALAEPDLLTEIVGSGDPLGGEALPGVIWRKMNLASSGNFSTNLSVLGFLTPRIAGVTSFNAKGIFASADAGETWEPVARLTGPAPGMGKAVFSGLRDPVNSSLDAGLAFLGTAKGDGVTGANNDGIWWQPEGEPLYLLAREGDHPSGAPEGAKWKSFTSLALPGGVAGPLFVANLETGVRGAAGPGGITSAQNVGLYGLDGYGQVIELLREGQPLLGKPVKLFNVLKAALGSYGVGRSYNAQGQVVVLVTYMDNSTAIVRIDLPGGADMVAQSR